MPTRYLKPGVRDSETIEAISPGAEILYYRLIVTVDDFGRYDARPSMVKAACFPIRDAMTISKVDLLLNELKTNGLIDVYQVGNKPYLQMCKWDNVPRAKESKYPAPDDKCIQVYADVCKTIADVPLTETVTKTVTKTVDTPEGVSETVWQEFVNHRKSKKAQITQTVINDIAKQASMAGWTLEDALKETIVRNWQSFKAEWVGQKMSKSAQTNSSVMSGLTRGLIGGGTNVKLLGN